VTASIFPADLAAPPEWIATADHPRFADAAQALAGNMLALCDGDRRLAAVFKDAGRYVTAMSVAYLDGAGGLTMKLLKQICAGTGFLSPGRARAIVEFLLHLDYLTPATDTKGETHYRPTAAFSDAWARHLRAAIAAAALIEPSLGPLAARLTEPAVYAALLTTQAARLHALARDPAANPFPALNRAFLHPHAGSQILWTLTLLGGNVTAPAGTILLPISTTSRRFGVTHLHVRRLLKRAQEEGLIVYRGRGRLSITDAGMPVIALHYAFQLAELVACGTAVLDALARDKGGPRS